MPMYHSWSPIASSKLWGTTTTWKKSLAITLIAVALRIATYKAGIYSVLSSILQLTFPSLSQPLKGYRAVFACHVFFSPVCLINATSTILNILRCRLNQLAAKRDSRCQSEPRDRYCCEIKVLNIRCFYFLLCFDSF